MSSSIVKPEAFNIAAMVAVFMSPTCIGTFTMRPFGCPKNANEPDWRTSRKPARFKTRANARVLKRAVISASEATPLRSSRFLVGRLRHQMAEFLGPGRGGPVARG